MTGNVSKFPKTVTVQFVQTQWSSTHASVASHYPLQGENVAHVVLEEKTIEVGIKEYFFLVFHLTC
jgi:hypothetical protein